VINVIFDCVEHIFDCVEHIFDCVEHIFDCVEHDGCFVVIMITCDIMLKVDMSDYYIPTFTYDTHLKIKH
jgi:hypothetical protein